jgi:hypothetical protein
MSPLLRRRRTADDEANAPSQAGLEVDRSASGKVETLDTSREAPPTVVQPVSGDLPAPAGAPTAPAPVPAGLAPEDAIGDRPDTRRRGRLRRRLRHLRRVRELMLRDVGGLVYEIHRAAPAGDGPSPARAHHEKLVRSKLDRLVELDAERSQLEDTLDDRRSETVLREPGVGGTCPGCGEYFASDARFCSGCGRSVDGQDELRTEIAPAEAGAPT